MATLQTINVSTTGVPGSGDTGQQVADKMIANDRALMADATLQINDLAALTPINVLGKMNTWVVGITGNGQRIGVLIAVNYYTKLYIHLTSTANFACTFYWQNVTGGANLVTPIPIVWVSDGAGGFTCDLTVTASSTAAASNLFLQITNTTVLTTAVTMGYTSISHDMPIKNWSVAAQTSIDSNTAGVTANSTALVKVDTSLKQANLDITAYADRQSIVLTAGQTAAARIQWTIPIAKLSSTDTIRVQFKSVNGANTGFAKVYKYASTLIANIAWTLNVGDGFYYSQVFDIPVLAADITANVPYVVIMQAFNAAGLAADTISNVQQLVIKTNYIDVNALKTQVDNTTTPSNLLNTLEIPWRGYGAMTVKKVKKDGTGDFTTIQQAINSITDAAINKQYDIQVYDDFEITDLTQLWIYGAPATHNTSATAPTQLCALVLTKNWVHVRGMGSPKRLTIESPTALASTSFQYVQTIYLAGNVILSNFYVSIKGGRYAIHQESGGSKLLDDYRATTILRNMTMEHKGNRAADGYTSAWTATEAQANGLTSGLKLIYENCEWRSIDVAIPFYAHTNADFDDACALEFYNCRMVVKGSYNLGAINPYWGDIGSGQKSKIKIVGCNFGRYNIQNNIRCTETALTLANKWDCGGASLEGYGNTPFAVNSLTPGVLSFATNANNVDIFIAGGTAAPLIFGNTFASIPGSVDAPGTMWGEIRIEDPQPSLGDSQIFSLPYRLGNCATTNKTLIINIGGSLAGGVITGGTNYTVTFNKNYMTTGGGAYAYNTVPALTPASILADINTALTGIATASLTRQLKTYTFDDCMEKGINMSAVTLNLNKGVVRDYSVNTYNAWRLSQSGEKAQGLVGKRINPLKSGNYFEGDIILLHKAYIPSSLLGLSVTGGAYYKCAADGSFVVGTSSDATFLAIDNSTLKLI
jgi:hypothetical protein